MASPNSAKESRRDIARRQRLGVLFVVSALFLLLLGAGANNVTGATQDPRDYLPLLGFGSLMLVGALGLLTCSLVLGGTWIRAASVFVSIPVTFQLVEAVSRILNILDGR